MEEKILNEALAVLEEQGPYAMFLYISARYKEGVWPMPFRRIACPFYGRYSATRFQPAETR